MHRHMIHIHLIERTDTSVACDDAYCCTGGAGDEAAGLSGRRSGIAKGDDMPTSPIASNAHICLWTLWKTACLSILSHQIAMAVNPSRYAIWRRQDRIVKVRY